MAPFTWVGAPEILDDGTAVARSYRIDYCVARDFRIGETVELLVRTPSGEAVADLDIVPDLFVFAGQIVVDTSFTSPPDPPSLVFIGGCRYDTTLTLDLRFEQLRLNGGNFVVGGIMGDGVLVIGSSAVCPQSVSFSTSPSALEGGFRRNTSGAWVGDVSGIWMLSSIPVPWEPGQIFITIAATIEDNKFVGTAQVRGQATVLSPNYLGSNCANFIDNIEFALDPE